MISIKSIGALIASDNLGFVGNGEPIRIRLKEGQIIVQTIHKQELDRLPILPYLALDEMQRYDLVVDYTVGLCEECNGENDTEGEYCSDCQDNIDEYASFQRDPYAHYGICESDF